MYRTSRPAASTSLKSLQGTCPTVMLMLGQRCHDVTLGQRCQKKRGEKKKKHNENLVFCNYLQLLYIWKYCLVLFSPYSLCIKEHDIKMCI